MKRTTRIVIDRLILRGEGSINLSPAAIRTAVENAVREQLAITGPRAAGTAVRQGVTRALTPALKQGPGR